MNNEMTAFKAMQTDLQVSMDDVVSAFVSKYETNLYARKKKLTTAIKGVEDSLTTQHKELLKKITGNSFKSPLPFGLKMVIDTGDVNWGVAQISFGITIKKAHSGQYGSSINITKTKPIPAAQVKANEKLEKELKLLRADLSEVLVALKSVTRKEREVRGRIAIRKLEDSGYANLMQDSELAKLVQLED